MNKQEFIERMKSLKNLFGNKFEYVEIDAVIELASELDEPQKVTVPQFVADWIEYFKNCKGILYGSTNPFSYYGRAIIEDFEGDYEEPLRWIRDNSDTYARAWLDGYEVEKEKRYIVKFKNVQSGSRYFKYDGVIGKWYFGINQDSNTTRLCHTKEELEEAGFGEVFNSPLFEVEEVQDDSKI